MAGLKLGPNEIYRDDLEFAATRTGFDAAALAALIDAEAAKLPNGQWNKDSAAPSSSAVGLTQFLEATWLDRARKLGSYLNEQAKAAGLLEADQRTALLALRTVARVSITTAAEFANDNLAILAKAGFTPASDDEKARLAYLAHHEGAGGARSFLAQTIGEARAQKLLETNVAGQAAGLHAQHGTWEAAYRAWLNGYIAKKIQPQRFRA
jgi:hypothetical protein